MDTPSTAYVEAVIETLRQRWGDSAIGHLPVGEKRRLPTGHPALDGLLGGGIPTRCISEISGAPSSGKTTLALNTVAACQREGFSAALVDEGRALAPDYAARCGVDLNDLLVVQPARAADCLEIAGDLAEEGSTALVVISGAVEPSKALGSAWQKLALRAAKSEAAVLALAPDGLSNRSWVVLRLSLERAGWLREGDDILGWEGRVTVARHKLGPAGSSVFIRLAPGDFQP